MSWPGKKRKLAKVQLLRRLDEGEKEESVEKGERRLGTARKEKNGQ